MEPVLHALKDQIKGEVRFDPITCNLYSVDASIYEVKPLGVVTPQDDDDLVRTLKIAAEHNVSVTPRGAATGITGSCLGKGLILDLSKNLNKILEINIAQEYAICQPGVVQDRLNEALAPFGYRLGPDTSTGNRATLGGMLANNSAGARSLHYGRMVDHILEVEMALTGGEKLTFSAIDDAAWTKKRQQKSTEGNIYNEVFRILKTHRKSIEKHFPKIPRHVSGYNLDLLYSRPLNLCKLIAGSEGTLGIVTKLKIKIAKKPRHTGLCILHLDDMVTAMKSIASMMKHGPLSLEMIDNKILNSARHSPAVRSKLQWLVGNPEAVFVAEFEGESKERVEEKLSAFSKDMNSQNIAYAETVLTSPQEMGHVWEVRKAGLGLLLAKRSYSRAIAFIEDISVPPDHLAAFIKEFRDYLKSVGKEAGIYGHIGSGCMHIRPYIDLRKSDELALVQEMMENVSSMVLRYGGAMSGEHGDGLIRSWLNEKMFGKEIYEAFKDIKVAFDPHNLMNPGKIVNAPPMPQDLRLSPDTTHVPIPTFLDFSNEGGIELAADLCNGNGQCRKMESVMCPSFQASGDESQTTRARAQTLRAIIHGKLPKEEFVGKGLHDILDLCIECKGCQRECPSQVDMAKMKSEFLYQYQEKHGYSLRNRLFGHMHHLNRIASPFARIFNAIASSSLNAFFLKILGVTSKRPLPSLAKEKFSTWFAKLQQKPSAKRVILFNDTYTEYNEPEIGKAAYLVLSALGYEVVLVKDQCCGRPLISKGLLKEAKTNAAKVLATLLPHLEQGAKIIALEPSCLSAFRDDFRGLLGKNASLDLLIGQSQSFEEFLQSHVNNGRLPLDFSDAKRNVWVHGHCHQKALVGMIPTLEVLRAIPPFTVHEIESGCCGMAGSFGYETEHYDFSMKIGELRLLPTVRAIDEAALVVASGISCRSQIIHGTNRRPLHLAEAIASHMRDYSVTDF